VFAAALAATRMDDMARNRLRNHLTAMREAGANRTKFIEADLKFHLELAAATQNRVLSDLLQSIRSLLRIWVERGIHEDVDAQLAFEEHEAVYEAIMSGDPAAATAAMQHHMDTATERLNRTLTA
jgi:GntR family transcriptional repressor for pyruvate dehydrogenase complex